MSKLQGKASRLTSSIAGMAQYFTRLVLLQEPHPQAPHLQPDAYGLIWMPEEGFLNAFAQNAPDDVKAVTASVQRPIAVRCIQEPSPRPAWRSRPSLFANDRSPSVESKVGIVNKHMTPQWYPMCCRAAIRYKAVFSDFGADQAHDT
jgi:hypothetical protein